MRDHRIHHREDVQLQVQYATLEEFLSDWTSNVSVGGMFLQTENPKPVGTKFQLRFRIPTYERTIEAQGEVCWVIPADQPVPPHAGMGVRFTDVTAEDQEAIRRLISGRQA